MLSTLRSSLCHRNNLLWSLFLNSRFRRGIIGAYHITLIGIFFFGRSSSSISPRSSHKILYHDALQTGHSSNFLCSPWYRMQSLGHACIFSICNPRGQTIFFASYIVVGNSLGFGSIFFWIFSNFPNALSDIPFSAFHCNNSSVGLAFSAHLRRTGIVTSCDLLAFGQT